MIIKSLVGFFVFSTFLIKTSFAAPKEEIRSFGHNLSHTDYTFNEARCTLGFQITACGGNDYIVGTSPFLISFYNMNNAYLRKNVYKSGKTTHSLELAYFQTYADEYTGFKMNSFWTYYIYSRKVSANYKFHFNIIGSYYSDDQFPFSLRRPTVNNTPYQFNISTLHEVKISKGISVLGEVGVLHVSDVYPRIHVGTSFVFKGDNFLAQIGFSMSSTYDGIIVDLENSERNDYQQELLSTREGYDQELNEEKIRTDFSLHPELAFQYFF